MKRKIFWILLLTVSLTLIVGLIGVTEILDWIPEKAADYAARLNLPPEVIQELQPLGWMDDNEKALIDEISYLPLEIQTNEYFLQKLKNVVEKDGVEKDVIGYRVMGPELIGFRDLDQDGLSNREEMDYKTNLLKLDTDDDWLSDRFELKYGTNPRKVDTDGDGIDDFNEIFTYPHLLNPLDPTDAQKFLAMIPNVKAKFWKWYETGGAADSHNYFQMIKEVAKRDPVLQWIAKNAEIKWDESGTEGHLLLKGERFKLQGTEIDILGHAAHPSYYFTHGLKGNCGEISKAFFVIYELMGYNAIVVSGREKGVEYGHQWLEVEIEGRTYTVEGPWLKHTGDEGGPFRRDMNITVTFRKDF